MTTDQHIVRDENAGGLLEMTLVFGVVTILGIRAFLALTGYPQLGGGNLHIAHTLWGGLGMRVAIALLLSYWNPAIRQLAAALGGVGFGFFIDELGKFITTDVDYFFQPTIALLYIMFISLFLVVRAIGSKQLSSAELAANKNIVAAMSAEGNPPRLIRIYTDTVEKLQQGYRELVATRWFAPAVSITFIVIAITQIITIIALVTGRSSAAAADRHIPLLEQAASYVSALFFVIGVIRLRHSRIAAYRWFMRGTLVNILVTQVFMFYYSELAALGGLIGHGLVYFALRFLIARETDLKQA